MSSDGQIRTELRRHKGSILHPIHESPYVMAWDGARMKRLRIHHAVLLAFVGKRPEGAEARHLNDEPDDNRSENLVWGTRRENMADRIRNGIQRRGVIHGTARLTVEQVRHIRLRVSAGETLRRLAGEYGVSHTAVRRAAIGLTWSHIT